MSYWHISWQLKQLHIYLHMQLYRYFNDNNRICAEQFDFRLNYLLFPFLFCMHCLLFIKLNKCRWHLQLYWTDYTLAKKWMMNIYFDLSKSVRYLRWQYFTKNLEHYGITITALSLFRTIQLTRDNMYYMIKGIWLCCD